MAARALAHQSRSVFARVCPNNCLADRRALKSSPGHHIELCILHYQGLLCQCQARLLSNRTSAGPNGVTRLLLRINSQRHRCHLIHLMWIRLTRTFAASSGKQLKRPSHAIIETTIIRAGKWSINPSTQRLQSSKGDNSSLSTTALLAILERKRRNQWPEPVRSIDFLHFSRKAWSKLNNLTGRL